MPRAKRKKITQEIIDGILRNELAIWIWAQVDNEKPFQMVFPGQAVLHDYPGRKSYFTAPNAEDKFYFKDFDYFWFVCKNTPPEEMDEKLKKSIAIMDEAYENPEAMPGRGEELNNKA